MNGGKEMEIENVEKRFNQLKITTLGKYIIRKPQLFLLSKDSDRVLHLNFIGLDK